MERSTGSARREAFIATCDANLRLVRTEADLTQEQMAYAVGLSKKTLVDIEKGRRSLGWSGAVTLCTVFVGSTVLESAFEAIPAGFIPVIAHAGQVAPKTAPPTSTWWEVVADNGRFIIEQNVISQHYRLLSADRAKVAASFDLADLMPIFNNESREDS